MTVTTERFEAVTRIVMDDGRANALSFELVDCVREAVAEATTAKSALVLAGRPGKFCAGFDLEVMKGSDPNAPRALMRAGTELVAELLRYDLPVVIECTGHALAAGAMLLMAADCRIGADGPFRIGFNEVKIGLAMPHSVLALTESRLSQQEHQRATLLSAEYSPAQARAAGFLDEVAAPELLRDRCIEVARTLMAQPRSAFTTTKRRVRRSALQGVDEALARADRAAS